MAQTERPTTLMMILQQLLSHCTASALSLFGAFLLRPSSRQAARTLVTHVGLPAGHRLGALLPRCSL